MIKCYLLSLPMNKYVVITAMVVLNSPLASTPQRSYCEIEYNFSVTAIFYPPGSKLTKLLSSNLSPKC